MTVTSDIIAQAISILGMIISVLSFQCKKTGTLCVWQAISGGLFSLSFVMMGAFSGAAMNFINVFRGFLFAFIPEKHRMKVTVLLVAAYVVGAGLTFGGFFSVLVCMAQIAGTVMMHIADGKKLRIVQLSFVSPAWLVHNIFYFSLGGIICECFSITSVIVSMIRYRGKFEK